MAVVDPSQRPDDVRVEPPPPMTPPPATGPTWHGAGAAVGIGTVAVAVVSPVTGKTAKALARKLPAPKYAAPRTLTRGQWWATFAVAGTLTVVVAKLKQHWGASK